MKNVHKQILHESKQGTNVDEKWVAMQTIKLYRCHVAAGKAHTEALQLAQDEMHQIAREALQRRENSLSAYAHWYVVTLGALACIGWWFLWE